jgi:hypothetical protein
MIQNLLRANLSTTDRYFSGIMELIFSDKPPKALIQKIEGTDDNLFSGISDEEGEETEDFGIGEFNPEPDEDEEEEGPQRRFG